jgi:hypothetical protein
VTAFAESAGKSYTIAASRLSDECRALFPRFQLTACDIGGLVRPAGSRGCGPFTPQDRVAVFHPFEVRQKERDYGTANIRHVDSVSDVADGWLCNGFLAHRS